MKSHDLAKLLLKLPDLPVSTHANNHTFNSYPDSDFEFCKIVVDDGKKIYLGNMSESYGDVANKAVKYRPHRGSLSEAMKEVEIFHCKSDFIDFLRKDLAQLQVPLDEEKLKIEYYGRDDRIAWETFIVTLDGFGVIGFTNGEFGC